MFPVLGQGMLSTAHSLPKGTESASGNPAFLWKTENNSEVKGNPTCTIIRLSEKEVAALFVFREGRKLPGKVLGSH